MECSSCTYVSMGSRNFGDLPMSPYRRPVWEFYAVLQGRICPWMETANPPTLQSNSLWLFPPGHLHGWRGEPRKTSQIIVFHFDTVPLEVQALTAKDGSAQFSLNDSDRLLLQRTGKEMLPHYWHSDPLLRFHSMRAALTLTVLLLEKVTTRSTEMIRGDSLNRVEVAEKWFKGHLENHPTLTNLARETGTSHAHLRRLFLKERGRSPKLVMQEIQMTRAKELLTQSNLKLDVVAAQSGFSSTTYFCKIFKQHESLTPNAYRQQNKPSC